MIKNRYEILNTLGQGGMGVVYEVKDHLLGTHVALKKLTIPEEYLDFSTRSVDDDTNSLRMGLAQEFKILATLRHPHIISVLDYGFDEDKTPFFTMELMENPMNLLEAAQALKPPERLELMLQVLQALRYLHRRNLLHRDLKPANILVTQDYHVKVVDFGLAIIPDQDKIEAAGTIGYLPPEVFQDQPLSTSSDLYAIGILLYQMMVGRLPFPINNVMHYLSEMLKTKPDLTKLEQIDSQIIIPISNTPETTNTIKVNTPDSSKDDTTKTREPNIQTKGELATVVGELLNVDPSDRPKSATEVYERLRAYLGQLITDEDEEIRESFLTASPLVGRHIELDALTTAFNAMLTGQSSIWLVGGESGVGKSRLVEELRIHALTKGATVIAGQATLEAAIPYELWQNPLESLALSDPLDASETAILQQAIPSLSNLDTDTIDNLTTLGSAQDEAKRVDEVLVKRFERINMPTLLILEDLQWAGLSTLQSVLSAASSNQNLMIVGTFRNDEAPSLPKDLPPHQLITLSRFSNEQVAELIRLMIGEDFVSVPMVALIQKETEGNVFFLIEVIRALAENAGGLSKIEKSELPQKVLTGGIQQILDRRIKHLPPTMRPILERVAVIGRQIRVDVLTTLIQNHAEDEFSIEQWLEAGDDVAILELYDQQWRFVHDRLREYIVDTLSNAPDVYRDTAIAIETSSEKVSVTDAALLVRLWNKAGNLQKELEYLQQVDHQNLSFDALTLLAYKHRIIEINDLLGRRTEIQTLQEAASLACATSTQDEAEKWLNRLESLNNLTMLQVARNDCERLFFSVKWGEKPDVETGIQTLEKHLETVEDDRIREMLYSRLAGAHMRLSNFERAHEFNQQSLELSIKQNADARVYETKIEIAHVLFQLGKLDEAKDVILEAIQFFETVAAEFKLAHAYNMLGIIYGRGGDRKTSLSYYLRTQELNRRFNDLNSVAVTGINLGVTYKNLGEYQKSLEQYAQSEKLFKQLNVEFGLAYVEINRALVYVLQEEYEKAIEGNQRSAEIANRLGMKSIIINACVGIARVALELENFERTAEFLFATINAQHQDANAIKEAKEVLEDLKKHLEQATLDKIEAQYQDVPDETILVLINEGV